MTTSDHPRLLFATSADALGRNIGKRAARRLLHNLDGTGAAVILSSLPESASWADAAAIVRHTLRSDGPLDGVVLVGGYDVVPAQRLDVLGPRLRASLPPTPDPDDFTVWSDDIYGDDDGDRLPELPVSRVPDCYSADLLQSILSPAEVGLTARGGIRNRERPFADDVFELLPGAGRLLTSAETVHNQRPSYRLDAPSLYFMLHGEWDDGSRFLGEDDEASPIAMTVDNVADAKGAIVLSGCCWGALTVDIPAVDAKPRTALKQRPPSSSIAMSFLARGARAFVGCTGSHYSPVEAPYTYNGEPLHRAFWTRIASGTAPARALFEAKYLDYAAAIPHGRSGTVARACECKVLREFTCLGLGW